MTNEELRKVANEWIRDGSLAHQPIAEAILRLLSENDRMADMLWDYAEERCNCETRPHGEFCEGLDARELLKELENQ